MVVVPALGCRPQMTFCCQGERGVGSHGLDEGFESWKLLPLDAARFRHPLAIDLGRLLGLGRAYLQEVRIERAVPADIDAQRLIMRPDEVTALVVGNRFS